MNCHSQTLNVVGNRRKTLGLRIAEKLRPVFFIALAALLGSCATFSSSSYDISDIRVELKQNGSLIELPASRPIKDVTAFISKDDWLIVTLVGASVDFDRLRKREPDDLLSRVQVVGYSTSVQLTLKLKKHFRSCEVVRPPGINTIDISLFE